MFARLEATMAKNIVVAMLCLVLVSTGSTSRADDALELEADSASYDNKTGVCDLSRQR